MLNITFVLKEKNGTKETPVICYIRYSNQRLKFYTGERMDPKFWNDNRGSNKYQRAKKSFVNAPEFNARLDHVEGTIKTIFRKYQNDNGNATPSPQAFKSLIDREFERTKEMLPSTFMGCFELIIAKSKAGLRTNPKTGKTISPNTVKTYTTTFNHLIDFQSQTKAIVDFENITHAFHADYHLFLTKTLKLSTNAIAKDWQILKLILNEATERGLNKNFAYKSRGFQIIRERSDNIYLTWSEVAELEKLDLSNESRLDRVRDLFLIGCHTGLRFSDCAALRPENFIGNEIRITQAKTGDPVVIPVHDVVKKIVSKYNGLLPEAITNQKTNEYLKEIGKKNKCLQNTTSKTITKGGQNIARTLQKWERLTTHTARRSFATNYYQDGIPTITIMAITGHKTEKAFMKYILATPSEHAKVLSTAWNKQKEQRAAKVVNF
jgi:integrase